ncbi:MAG: TIGR03067 domain-containing protein [Verrucomicrobia bacterium]|nr:TIGR03067 domain-containing protein [Verrucomicrobiota bacterium]
MPLSGTWQIVKAELAGEEMPAFVASRVEVELADGTYVVRFAGQVADRGTFTLAADGGVQEIRLYGVEGTNAGRTIPAIYQQVGDRLRICYGLDGIRPSTFATAAGQNLFLATYRRREEPS